MRLPEQQRLHWGKPTDNAHLQGCLLGQVSLSGVAGYSNEARTQAYEEIGR